jgi:hypothetical protein
MRVIKVNEDSRRDRWILWMLAGTAIGVTAGVLAAEKFSGRNPSAKGLLRRARTLVKTARDEWGPMLTLALELRDCTRAVLRGLGAPLRAAPFDLEAIANTSAEVVQLSVDLKGPINAKDAVLIASLWMLREVELAAAKVQQVTFLDGDGTCGTGTIDLPVSKADIQALGKLRTHVCICPSPLCPVAALRRLVLSAHSFIADDVTPASVSLPLVPDFFGVHVDNKDMAAAFSALAIASGMDQGTRITGHSP